MSEQILREYPNLYHDGKFFMYGSANVNGFAVARLFEIPKDFFEREMYPGLVKDYIRCPRYMLTSFNKPLKNSK